MNPIQKVSCINRRKALDTDNHLSCCSKSKVVRHCSKGKKERWVVNDNLLLEKKSGQSDLDENMNRRKAVGHSRVEGVEKEISDEKEQQKNNGKKQTKERLSEKGKSLKRQETLPCVKRSLMNDLNSEEMEEREAVEDEREAAEAEENEVLTKHEVEYLAQIAQFLHDNNINLEPNPPTKGDGNCWYRAAASQVILHKIQNKPKQHFPLRQAVANHLKNIPTQLKENLVDVVFNGKARGLSDLACRQRKLGQWVDNMGVMVMATAQYLGRNIHLYGYPSDTGCKSRFSLTRIEGGGQADKHPPLTVFFHAHHYQTLQRPYSS